jgi:hypothetical protein
MFFFNVVKKKPNIRDLFTYLSFFSSRSEEASLVFFACPGLFCFAKKEQSSRTVVPLAMQGEAKPKKKKQKRREVSRRVFSSF